MDSSLSFLWVLSHVNFKRHRNRKRVVTKIKQRKETKKKNFASKACTCHPFACGLNADSELAFSLASHSFDSIKTY